MLDLRQLRQFVAVAEAEHVGRAAERLNMSQSPLSRQIQQLEASLGLSLFERVRKRVRLTREGRAFLAEARALLAQAERMEARARHVGRGEAGTLAVGYVAGAAHARLLPAALRRLQAPRPALRIELKAQRSGAQREALRRHEIDCGVLYNPPAADDPDLASRHLLDEALLLAVPADHPLATAPAVGPADLAGLAWIGPPRGVNPDADARLLGACAACGFAPDHRIEANDPTTSLSLVAVGLGIALAQASLRSVTPPGVALREIPWFPLSVRLHAAWRRDDPRPLVGELVALLAAD